MLVSNWISALQIGKERRFGNGSEIVDIDPANKISPIP